MTGIDLLGWSQAGLSVRLHTSATDLLLCSYTALCQREISASIILAHALELVQEESERLYAYRRERYITRIGISESEPRERSPIRRNFWLTVWGCSTPQTEFHEPLLVLSCLEWALGDYPIFLWSSDQPGTTAEDELHNRLRAVQSALLDIVQPHRVFSVFGRSDLVAEFKRTWVARTGIIEEPEPFYEALLTYCTKDSFRPFEGPRPGRDSIRIAEPSDLTSVANLCKEFAETSVRFQSITGSTDLHILVDILPVNVRKGRAGSTMAH